jgi:hypothetical protein
MKSNNQPEMGDEGTGYEKDGSPFLGATALWLPSMRVWTIRASWLFALGKREREWRKREKRERKTC